MGKASGHYVVLDGFRGVAALAVMVLHASIILTLPYRPQHAALAVDFFFCLSGFVIAHAYDPAFAQGRIDLRAFARKRVIRLYPMILLGVVLGTLSTLLSATHGAPQPLPQVLFLGVSAALLIPGGILFNLQAFPVDSPLWSLFFEGIANVFYGVEAARGERRAPSAGFLIIAGVLLVSVAVLYRTVTMLGFQHGYWLIGGLARVGFPFLAGVLIRRSGIYRKMPKVPDYVLAAVLAAVLFGPSIRFNVAYDLVAILVVFPLIVSCGARESSSRAANRAWIILGELSYPLYAIHEPVIMFVTKLQNHVLHVTSPVAVAAMGMAAATIAAAMALQFYDKPARAWLGTKPWRVRQPATAG